MGGQEIESDLIKSRWFDNFIGKIAIFNIYILIWKYKILFKILTWPHGTLQGASYHMKN